MNYNNINANSNGHGPVQANKPNDSDMEIKKYLRILRKRKWVILFTAMIVFSGWVGYVFLYGSAPVYTASTLLQFEDERNYSAVEDRRRTDNRANAKLLKTNKLLGKIVEDFQWNLSVREDNMNREDLFSYTVVTRESRAGDYKLVPNSGKYELYFTNELLGIKNKLISAFMPVDTVAVHDMEFVINHDYIKNIDAEQFEFRIVPFEKAIQTLDNSFNYQIDRSQTSLTIHATSGSARLAAQLANTLADRFVAAHLEYNLSSDVQEKENLERQLQIARADLDAVNDRLQAFREKHPFVDPTGAASSMPDISQIETDKAGTNNNIQVVRGLRVELNQATSIEEQMTLSSALLTALSSQATTRSYSDEFNNLQDERTSLLQRGYSDNHRDVIDNSSRIAALIDKIKQSADQYVVQLETRVASLDNQIAVENRKIRGLPQLERELWELMRERETQNGQVESISSRYNDAVIKVETQIAGVRIVDEAVRPPLQGRGSVIMKKSILGLVLGIGLGLGLGIVLEYFDKTVQTSDDLHYRLQLPVLGSIPVIAEGDEVPENIKDIKGKRDTKLITLDYSPTLESESYRDLRTKILFMNQNNNLSSFLISSLRPSEGKSLTVSNLAITFAQQKISTLLIDADLRRGVLHNVYGNKKKPGLSDFLISKATLDYDNINKLIQKTFIPNLYLITTGSPIPNPTEMLGSERMINLLNILKSRFGMVILDTAPFEASSDSAILANHVNGVLLVVRADYTNVDQLGQKIQEYPPIQRNILGLVLNMEKVDSKRQPYQYSYYNY